MTILFYSNIGHESFFIIKLSAINFYYSNINIGRNLYYSNVNTGHNFIYYYLLFFYQLIYKIKRIKVNNNTIY